MAGGNEVGLVEDDEVGLLELGEVELADGALMHPGAAVHHGDGARGSELHFRQAGDEAHDASGVGDAGSLDEDFAGPAFADGPFEGELQLVLQRAADTAVIELIHGEPLALNEFPVEAEAPELVDEDHGVRSDAGGKDMLHEAGLAGPQKTAEKIN